MTIGECIKLRRKEKGLSQKELALKIGIATNSLSRYEIGERNISWEMLAKIASALDIGTTELIEGADVWGNIVDHTKNVFKDYQEHPEKYTVEVNENGKQTFFINTDRAEMIRKYDSLNQLGQSKVNEYVKDIADNPNYKKH